LGHAGFTPGNTTILLSQRKFFGPLMDQHHQLGLLVHESMHAGLAQKMGVTSHAISYLIGNRSREEHAATNLQIKAISDLNQRYPGSGDACANRD
jgi:hypothetical protein